MIPVGLIVFGVVIQGLLTCGNMDDTPIQSNRNVRLKRIKCNKTAKKPTKSPLKTRPNASGMGGKGKKGRKRRKHQ